MKKAFTMVELIFVIVIIGILGAVAIPKLSASRDDAQVSSMANSIAAIISEVSAYATSQGEVSNDFTVMSNIASNLIEKNKAVQSGDTLNIKMSTVNDCLKIVLSSSSSDVNLTLGHGSPGSDAICQNLQKLVKKVKNAVPLQGKRLTY